MTFHQDLRHELIRDENSVPYAYEDSEGYLTIGVGHLIDKRLNGSLPSQIIDDLLDYDIATVIADLNSHASWWKGLPEEAQRGLVNMCFNLGWPRLSKFERMIEALKLHSFDIAAHEALNSVWATQVGIRAERIAELFRASKNQ